jgi:hypothetical protein
MAINQGSRYEKSTVDYISLVPYGSATPIVFYKFDSLKSVSFIYHTYVSGETLYGISNKYFNRPDLWWAITEYNPEITDFYSITPGTIMRIPSV